MRFKIFKRTFVVFFILMAIFLIGCQKTQEYPIHTQQCEWIFGQTPKQLMKSKHDCMDTVGDFRRRSYVDKNGHLCLVLTESQAEAMKEWLVEFPELDNRSDVEVSEDLSSVTVYFSPKLLEEGGSELDSLVRVVNTVAGKIMLKQRLDGVPPEEVSFLYTERNIETGEVIYTEVYKPILVDS